MKFDSVTSEKGAAEKGAEVLIAIGWLVFYTLLSVMPVVVLAVWRSLL